MLYFNSNLGATLMLWGLGGEADTEPSATPRGVGKWVG